MNKLIKTHYTDCYRVLGLFGVNPKTVSHTVIPDGYYFITDESGLGVHGVSCIHQGKARSQSLRAFSDLEAFCLDKEDVILSSMHQELKTQVASIPFSFELFFSMESTFVLFGGFRLSYSHYTNHWRFKGVKDNNWKSFLVENELTEEEVFSYLARFNNLRFDNCLFYYAPSKGIYLP